MCARLAPTQGLARRLTSFDRQRGSQWQESSGIRIMGPSMWKRDTIGLRAVNSLGFLGLQYDGLGWVSIRYGNHRQGKVVESFLH